jgi:hypothetical protein
VIVGTAVLLLGMIYCTERVDRYWKSRAEPASHVAAPASHRVPPFRMSHDQCVDCGRDDEPLNLEERCFYCHVYAHGG